MEESENLYKLYGYGLCKENPIPRIAGHKVQETLHFRYLKFFVIQASLSTWNNLLIDPLPR